MSPWLPQLLADQRVDLVAAQLTALAQRHGHPLDGVPVATHQSLRLPLDGSHHAAAAPRGCRAAEQRDEGAPPHDNDASRDIRIEKKPDVLTLMRDERFQRTMSDEYSFAK